jgi:Zn-dependent M16 (insulinase) family peptidase
MSVFQSVIGSWLHGGDAVEPLRVTEHVERLRRELAAPGAATSSFSGSCAVT